MHVLCKEGQVDAVAAVLRRGVDINIVNKVIADMHVVVFATIYCMYTVGWVDLSTNSHFCWSLCCG